MNQKDKVERLAEYGAKREARLLARIEQLEEEKAVLRIALARCWAFRILERKESS